MKSEPAMPESEQLQTLRERIDALDTQIQKLIDERAHCALQVATVKQSAGGGRALYYRPEREAQILRRVCERNAGPLADRTVAHLFREIISACLALEQSLTVAFLGPLGSFTQAAALKHFGRAMRIQPLPSVDDIFREVEADGTQFGVVPADNTIEEASGRIVERFLHSPVGICGEVRLSLHHLLLGRAAHTQHIEQVHARQVTLLQCREWLDAHLPQAERVPVASHHEAVQQALKDSSNAAIAGETAATAFELPVLVRNIEDDPETRGRFLVLGKQPVGPSGRDRTTVLAAVANRPGLAHRLLEPLARHDIGLAHIESHPLRREHWDQAFLLDLEGHREEPSVARALEELGAVADHFKVLGSYPVDSLQ